MTTPTFLDPPPAPALPSPPRLHWAVVLALSVITVGFFGVVWLFVQANWVRKVTGARKAFGWTLAYMLYLPGSFVLGIVVAIIALLLGHRPEEYVPALQAIVRLAGIALYVLAAYSLKAELQARPIQIPLGGVMTFFFATSYFQYHLHDFQWETSSRTPADGALGLGGPLAPILTENASTLPTHQQEGR